MDDTTILALETIFRMLSNIRYEISGGVYELDDYEMGTVFYCRDLAWQALKEYKQKEGL